MRRRALTHDNLLEEARFILRTLKRDDLFGERVRLAEAERIIDSSISLSFSDYCAFLSKYAYIRVDPLASTVEVTEAGEAVVRSGEDPEFHARLGRHFARELGTAPALRTGRKEPPPPPPATGEPPAPLTPPRAAAIVSVAAPARAVSIAPAGEDVIDRRYRRGEAIGAGPSASVFKAEQIVLGRTVAIKEARSIFQYASYLKREEIVRRLKATVQAHARLQHPNVIQILDQNHEREFPYFVMEYAAGGSLRERMAASPEGRLDLTFAVRVLTQICYALQYAHEQDVLHLGLKPENVLFDQLGNVKLGDFGFSRVMDREEEGNQVPVLIGSGAVAYMPPERLVPDADAATLSSAADVYGVGILIYQMLTGKLPGRRSPLPSKARKDVPAQFDEVFDLMTRDELSERYVSIADVLAGIYKAFPSKEVFAQGTILLWAADPAPPPEVEADVAPEPDAVVSDVEGVAPQNVVAVVSDAAPTGSAAKATNGARHESEAETGEVNVSSFVQELQPRVSSAIDEAARTEDAFLPRRTRSKPDGES